MLFSVWRKLQIDSQILLFVVVLAKMSLLKALFYNALVVQGFLVMVNRSPHSSPQSHSRGACKIKDPLFCAQLILSSIPFLANFEPLIANMNSKFANFIICGK